MTINYYTKEIYGKQLFYLAKPTDAIAWRTLTNKKTLDEKDMRMLTTLTGVTFNRVFEAEA